MWLAFKNLDCVALDHGFSTGVGGITHQGEILYLQGGILYLEFCLRCNVIEECNIVASSSVSLLIAFVKSQCSVSAFRNSRYVQPAARKVFYVVTSKLI